MARYAKARQDLLESCRAFAVSPYASTVPRGRTATSRGLQGLRDDYGLGVCRTVIVRSNDWCGFWDTSCATCIDRPVMPPLPPGRLPTVLADAHCSPLSARGDPVTHDVHGRRDHDDGDGCQSIPLVLPVALPPCVCLGHAWLDRRGAAGAVVVVPDDFRDGLCEGLLTQWGSDWRESAILLCRQATV